MTLRKYSELNGRIVTDTVIGTAQRERRHNVLEVCVDPEGHTQRDVLRGGVGGVISASIATSGITKFMSPERTLNWLNIISR